MTWMGVVLALLSVSHDHRGSKAFAAALQVLLKSRPHPHDVKLTPMTKNMHGSNHFYLCSHAQTFSPKPLGIGHVSDTRTEIL